MRTFKTLNQVLKAVDYQLSVQQLLNNRVHLKNKGWTAIKLTEELTTEIIERTVEILGGHYKTRSTVEKALKYREPQHWTLERMFINSYGNGAKISYCAGQDYTSEMNTGRTAIKLMY
jgi:hypothetical protein